MLEAVDAAELPVLTYGGRGFPPAAIERTLLPYEFPLVIAHLGGYPLDETLTAAAIDLLGAHENCYLDTSFVRRRDPLERAITEHPDRVLFGSGASAAHPNVAVMEILTPDVPENAVEVSPGSSGCGPVEETPSQTGRPSAQDSATASESVLARPSSVPAVSISARNSSDAWPSMNPLTPCSTAAMATT